MLRPQGLALLFISTFTVLISPAVCTPLRAHHASAPSAHGGHARTDKSGTHATGDEDPDAMLLDYLDSLWQHELDSLGFGRHLLHGQAGIHAGSPMSEEQPMRKQQHKQRRLLQQQAVGTSTANSTANSAANHAANSTVGNSTGGNNTASSTASSTGNSTAPLVGRNIKANGASKEGERRPRIFIYPEVEHFTKLVRCVVEAIVVPPLVAPLPSFLSWPHTHMATYIVMRIW